MQRGAPALVDSRTGHEQPAVLELLDGFRLCHRGREIELTMSCQRVLAFLALRRGAALRVLVAAMLWPDGTEEHARGNLRSAVWRIQQTGADLVESSRQTLRLGPAVTVDVDGFTDRAHALIKGQGTPQPEDLRRELAGTELLPGWYEDWVLVEREQLRQLRLHGLEALSLQLVQAERFAEAIHVGLAAVAIEPLRESAHRVLVTAFLAEGNPIEALRQYETYRRMLWEQLAVVPSAHMEALIRSLRDAPLTRDRR
jgi:DNA-binding SARP family transcriptional activator